VVGDGVVVAADAAAVVERGQEGAVGAREGSGQHGEPRLDALDPAVRAADEPRVGDHRVVAAQELREVRLVPELERVEAVAPAAGHVDGGVGVVARGARREPLDAPLPPPAAAALA
jgi:hypothetical protein